MLKIQEVAFSYDYSAKKYKSSSSINWIPMQLPKTHWKTDKITDPLWNAMD